MENKIFKDFDEMSPAALGELAASLDGIVFGEPTWHSRDRRKVQLTITLKTGAQMVKTFDNYESMEQFYKKFQESGTYERNQYTIEWMNI